MEGCIPVKSRDAVIQMRTGKRNTCNLGIIFHITPLKRMLCSSLEPSHRDGFNEGSQHMFTLRNKKNHFRIDLFHIVISLSLEARYLARFRVTSHPWGKL